MLQVGKLRLWTTDDGEIKPYFKAIKNLNYNDLKQLLDNVERDLKDIVPAKERYNIFYTVAHHLEGQRTKKSWQAQEIIPFDLDGIDLAKIDEYPQVVADACGFDLDKCAIVHTGNGVHILVQVEQITDVDYIKNARKAYIQLCERIVEACTKLSLPITKDSTAWDYARILRCPGTENRKEKNGKIDVKHALLHRNGLITQDWKLPVLEKLPEKLFMAKGSFPKPDHETILNECKFFNWLKDKPDEVHEPHAYAMLSIAGHFHDDKKTVARSLYSSFSSPSINSKTFDEFLDQALRSSGPRTCAGIDDIWGKCNTCPHHKLITSPILLRDDQFIGTEHCGFTLKSISGKTWVRQYGDLRKFYYRKHPYRFITEASSLYVYTGTHYEERHINTAKNFAEVNFKPEPKEAERVEFIKNLEANNIEPLAFVEKKPAGKINFLNGVLDIDKKTMSNHSPDYNFTTVLPFDYDAKATCPNWDKFIKDVTLNREDLIELLHEFMGYCLYGGEYIHHKALILNGSGSNGKSTFIDVLKGIMGEDNYATTPLTSIGSDKFAIADLHNKLVNISEEEPPSCFKETGVFKNLTGNNVVAAQKKFKDTFKMLSRAKIVITYNEMPYISDRTTGMKRRLMVVPFDLDLERKPELKDERIKYKLEKEYPGIFNRALEGWKRLEKRGRFTNPQSVKDAVKELIEASSSFHMWADERLTITNNEVDIVLNNEAFQDYLNYMESNKERNPLGRKKFIQEIKNAGLDACYTKVRAKTQRAFRGARLIDSVSHLHNF